MVVYTEMKSFFPHRVMLVHITTVIETIRALAVYIDIQFHENDDDCLKNLYVDYNDRMWFTGLVRTEDTVLHYVD